jgi:hypothetical protein
MIVALDHVDKNAFSTLTSPLSQVPNYGGATNPTGPEAIHTDKRRRVRPHLDRIAGSRQPYESK